MKKYYAARKTHLEKLRKINRAISRFNGNKNTKSPTKTITSRDLDQLISETFLRTVSRFPTALERAKATTDINKAKNTCRSLGFEEGTDKFTDCSLKLYTQDVDNKVALKVSKQKSSNSSSSGSMIIYDPVRDRQNQIDKGMKMLSGGCTLGIDC